MRRNKVIKRYNLGSFVSNSNNVMKVTNAASQITGNGVLSSAASGAALGSIFPGAGSIIGAGAGLLTGAIGSIFGGRRRRRRQRELINQQNALHQTAATEQLEAGVTTENDNPLGVYQDGGDVLPNIINIEKGETQVDVASGKILRKYDGINPETGGLYQEHNEEGEDPIDNLVTAEEGTFIITKEASKKYREAVKNNDKITQETIMQNIRNKKKSLTGVYQDGGRVRRLNNFRLPDIVNPAIGTSLLGTDPNRAPIDAFGSPSASTSVTGYTPEAALSMVPSNVMESGTSRSSNLARNIETGLGYATQLLPGVANLIQGASSPNYMTPNRVGVNPTNRQAILNSLPTEVSANPAVNNARAARYNMMRDIDRNTSDANIRRALKTGTASALINQENEAYYNNQILNNQIKAQRAGILSGLEQMDTQREMFNAQQMMNINHTNRMMDLAKRQQSNTGLSQIARGIQNRIDSRVKDRAGDQMLDVMSQIAPEAAFLFNQFKRR